MFSVFLSLHVELLFLVDTVLCLTYVNYNYFTAVFPTYGLMKFWSL